MKNNKLKGKSGITLIALVITIIVMLILVAVTITMAVNGGLFSYAKNATGEMKNAIDIEQQLGNGKIKIGETWYNSIDEYLGTETTTETHSWTRSGDTFTCSHCEAKYIMGEIVKYTDAGVASTTLTAAKSGLDKYFEDQGEYPDYALIDGEGNQTIEAQDVKWIVLGIEDTDENGTYETLLITTETDVWTVDEDDTWYGVHFYGAAAYNSAADEINRICKELYSNSEYGEARGMTIEDVNSVFNYTPTGGIYYDGEAFQYTNGFTTKLKDLPIYRSITAEGTETPNGTALGEFYLNGYSYWLGGEDGLILEDAVNDTLRTITKTERKTIFGPWVGDWDSYYCFHWLAFRYVSVEGTYDGFGIGMIDNGGVGPDYNLFYFDGEENGGEAGLRPVVSLKSKLPESMPKISFTFDGVSGYAEEGMTWGEWIESPYNTLSFEIGYYGSSRREYIETGNFYELMEDDGDQVEVTDTIISGGRYTASSLPM